MTRIVRYEKTPVSPLGETGAFHVRKNRTPKRARFYFFRKLAKGEILRRSLTICGITSMTRSISASVL